MNIFSKLFGFFTGGGLIKKSIIKPMYSIQEASKVTGIPEKEFYELIQEGKVKALQLEEKGRYRIPRSEIERLSKQ